VVEQLADNPKFKGSNPAAGRKRKTEVNLYKIKNLLF
jgi:hypothetical protein